MDAVVKGAPRPFPTNPHCGHFLPIIGGLRSGRGMRVAQGSAHGSSRGMVGFEVRSQFPQPLRERRWYNHKSPP